MRKTVEPWVKIYLPVFGGLVATFAVLAIPLWITESLSTAESISSYGYFIAAVGIIALGFVAGKTMTKTMDAKRETGKIYSTTAKVFILIGAVILGALPGLLASAVFIIFAALKVCSLQPKCI